MSSDRRSILITGCTKGSAGHALAVEFASHGLRVFATARSLSSLEGLSEHGIETLSLDVTSPESISALKREIETRNGGKLDILFNNAGSMYEAPAIEADPVRVRNMFNANVFGVFDMVSAFTPLLLAAKSDASQPPTIINTASVLAVVPYPFSSAYNATKAAVAAYSDTLRLELAPLGVKVVTLYMGVVSTGLSSPDGISFDPTSIYISAEAGVKKRSRDHQATGMRASQFAREVANEILVKKPGSGKGEYVWKGTNALLVWFLHLIGWRKIFDSSSEAEIEFTKETKRLIAERALKSSR
ncbi:NADPH-dependent 1-acyldihydroxyacetone phosphate reductase 4 [Stagonosporopsis vannaccii]|nr:NADPH-dependent 1-acyldihydroxyacetone phosphate reductase 4 [Stagonosporopsis vannaccii]